MRIENGKFIFTKNEAVTSVGTALLIAGVFFFIIGGNLEKQHDAERLHDMSELRQALRLYKVAHGHFPIMPEPTAITGKDIFSRALLDDLIISEVFIDPVHPDFMYSYQSNQKGTHYVLRFCLEGNALETYTKGCDNVLTP